MQLEREIIWRAPSLRRRIGRIGILVVAGLTVTVGLAAAPRSFGSEPSRAQRAEQDVMRLAFEAYPQWRADHPDRRCPERLAQITDREALDPWGRALQYTCDPRLLRTKTPGIEITSSGEDGVFGTSDDIRSDQ